MKLKITFWLKAGGIVSIEDIVWPDPDAPSPKEIGILMAASGGLKTPSGGWVFCDDKEIVLF